MNLSQPPRHSVYPSGASIPIAGEVSSGPVDIEASFAGGDWTTIAQNVSGAFIGSLSPSDGYGRLTVRIVGTTRVDWRDNIDIGPQFTLVSSEPLDLALPGDDWAGRVVVWLLANGTLVMWHRSSKGHADDPTATCCIRFSTDDGNTWSDANTFTDGEPVSGMPIMAHEGFTLQGIQGCQAPGGPLLTTINEKDAGGTWLYRSTDNGASWSVVTQFGGLIGADPFMVKGSRVYMPVRSYETADGSHPHEQEVWVSDDNGLTFEHLSTIMADDGNEIALLDLGGTSILAIVRNAWNTGTPHVFRSDDDGETWAAVDGLAAALRVYQRPYGIAHDGGHLIAGRYAQKGSLEQWSVLYWLSPDLELRRRVWLGTTPPDGPLLDTGYCAAHVLPSGDIHVYDYRGDTQGASVWRHVLRLSS